jgi:hypothetical protein
MTSDTYFPPAEAEGGWRYAQSPEEVRDRAHLDPEKLLLGQREFEWHWGGHAWSMAVIRHGVLAAEFGSYNVLDGSRFDLWSATKSFTSIAFGILLADQAQRETGTNPLALDSRAYELIPEGYPLTDDRKALITVRQLLTMTGGFVGSVRGTAPGTPTALGDGLFEHASTCHASSPIPGRPGSTPTLGSLIFRSSLHTLPARRSMSSSMSGCSSRLEFRRCRGRGPAAETS